MTRRILMLVGLVLLAGLVKWQIAPVDVAPATSLEQLPFTLGAWAGRRAADYDPRVLAVLGVDDYVNRAYFASGDRQANVYVGYYRSQRQGASIHSPLNCMPGAGWEAERTEHVAFEQGSARRVIIRKGTQRLLVVYWYQTVSRIEGDEYLGRLYTLLDTMRHGRNDAALVRVTVPAGSDAGDEARADEYAFELAKQVQPHVGRLLFPDGPEQAVARLD
jgi:EpsI family protein